MCHTQTLFALGILWHAYVCLLINSFFLFSVKAAMKYFASSERSIFCKNAHVKNEEFLILNS